MACYRPLQAWQSHDGKIVVCKKTQATEARTARLGPDHKRSLELPCGRCIGCRIDRTKQWAARCVHEASQHDENSFLTLTIDQQKLTKSQEFSSTARQDRPLKTGKLRARTTRANAAPSKETEEHTYTNNMLNLSKRTHQLFIKRLRKHLGPNKPIAFFMCGEYGKKLTNPHYHYLIFGHNFNDRIYIKKSGRKKLYESPTLDKLWGHGLAWIGDVTPESAAYVAGYVLKKITGDKALNHYKGLTPEFGLMSRNPAIGKNWIEQYHTETYTHDKIFQLDFGQKPPRYYDDYLKKYNPTLHETIKLTRSKAAAANPDNTPSRRADRELYQTAKHNLKKRQLETQ
jgi:hypothetical protein